MKMEVTRLGAALAAALVVSVACGGEQEADEGPSRLTVEVTRGNLTIRAEATGTIEPVRSVEVKSKASGEILHLHADVGDRVSRGTLLAEIDPRDVQNNYNQVRADLAVAEARMEISESQLERSQQLLDAEIITRQEHENARLDYANSQTSLLRAQTNFQLAELQLQDVRITAPMDGTIIQKNVEEGVVIQSASQNVSGGTTLFLMADLGEMQVRTLVDETDMGLLQPGMSTHITVEAYPDRTFDGLIEKIEPQAVVEQNVTMFPVIVTLDNSSGLLRPGMNAEVEIFIDEARDALLVANNAIVSAEDVGPAALALGLDVDRLDLTPFMQVGAGADGFAAQSGSPGGGVEGRAGGAPDLDPETRERMQEMRAQVQSGEISRDSVRSALQGLRGGRADQPVGDRLASGENGEGATRRVETRPGAVFVLLPTGEIEPRPIRIGLGDWDHTAVTGDVQAGDVLVILGAAQLQAQQQAWLDRMRDRMGSDNPFGGGMPGGRGFRGRRF